MRGMRRMQGSSLITVVAIAVFLIALAVIVGLFVLGFNLADTFKAFMDSKTETVEQGVKLDETPVEVQQTIKGDSL